MNTAILAAAGSGKRFGSEIPKQFIEVAGKPIIIHTLERFEKCPDIDKIILLLPESEISSFSDSIQLYKISKLEKIIAGGASRAGSVLNGINALGSETDIVAIHDGARPLVSLEEISRVIEKAEETGAACLVGKITDTIKEIDGNLILSTLDRTKLRRALTPQAFSLRILKRAFAENEISDKITDESSMVEKMGVEVSFIEGSSRNIKITTKEDLVFAKEILESGILENV
jgi:2-C-methyl-D-erythritol 4-phosphate cytidylyltransferase